MNSLDSVLESLDSLNKSKDDAKDRSDQGSMDIPLPGAVVGKVVTRFPPEPSGYLHIGHAKAALLNDYFAKLYKGKMLLRFDDTNPSKEKVEFEESIKEDLKMLEITPNSISHTSEHFQVLYEYALKMIRLGKAYVDDTDVDSMREMRGAGIESKNRSLSVEENLKLFQEMTDGTEKGLTCCLRAKIDMQDKNKCMRDPVIYRCNLTPHHLTGDKWKLYPTCIFDLM
jgi:glutamyl-tRNA synthetase